MRWVSGYYLVASDVAHIVGQFQIRHYGYARIVEISYGVHITASRHEHRHISRFIIVLVIYAEQYWLAVVVMRFGSRKPMGSAMGGIELRSFFG